ncbi:MAG TPA: GNAT family N-acetyltransferase [Fimbriimonas sp.]|nr:GNAT family N-acetyltransferase [Fimbriimonas sp.]
MRIRPTTLDDIEAIVSVHVAAWNWAHTGIVPDEIMAEIASPGRVQKIREQWDPRRAYLVAEDSSENVVGFSRENLPVGIEGFDCEIGSLYVHPDFARQGIGRELVRSMAQVLSSGGNRSLCLQTLRDNRIGTSFYESIGGQRVSTGAWCGLPSVWFGWRDLSSLVNA